MKHLKSLSAATALAALSIASSSVFGQSAPPAVIVSGETIASYLQAGEQKRGGSGPDFPSLRIATGNSMEGVGYYHVSILRRHAPVSPFAHPSGPQKGTEIHFILDGGGVSLTGGAYEPSPASGAAPGAPRKHIGGQSRRVGPGDVVLIPAGALHGYSQIDGHLTYVEMRWDTHPTLNAFIERDPLNTSGKPPVLTGPVANSGRDRSANLADGSKPSAPGVYIPAADHKQAIAKARQSGSQIAYLYTGEIAEGVGYSQLTINTVSQPSLDVDDTGPLKGTEINIILEGSATSVTGGRIEGSREDGAKGRIVGMQDRPAKAGDIIVIPAGSPHGYTDIRSPITYASIRFDTHPTLASYVETAPAK